MSEREPGAHPPWARWEWAALAATAGALVVYAAFPVWRGPALSPEGAQFGGIAVGVRDAQFYLSLIRQNVGLSPFVRNPFGEPGQDRIFWGLFWWALAHVRQVTGLSPPAVYNVARYVGAGACVVAIAAFATLTTRTRGERWLAIQLATWAGGFGWLVGLTGWHGYRSADLLTPETTTYYTVLTAPHLAAALALLVGSFAAVLAATEHQRARPWGWAAGVMAMLLGFFHPFNLLVLLAAWGLHGMLLLARDRSRCRVWLRCGWPLAAGGAFAVAYFAVVLAAYPVGLPATVVRRLPYGDLALGFGVLGIGAAAFALSSPRRRVWSASTTWTGMWIVATLLLMHSYPVLKQEGRAVLGLHVPLAVWTALFLGRSVSLWPRWARGGAGVALVAATLPTAFWVQHERLQRMRTLPARYYVLEREAAAAHQLATRVHRDDRIACGTWSGLMLASRVPARLFLGRWDEPSAREHETVLNELFAVNTPGPTRRALADRYGITVLWVGEAEHGAYPTEGLRRAVRDLATEVLVDKGGVLAVRVAPPGA